MNKLKGRKERSREKQRNAAPTPKEVASTSVMFRWTALLGCLVLATASTYFVLTIYVISQLPNEIVGTWQVQGGEMNGVKMTFHPDGSFTSMVMIEGREIPIEARVAMRDKTLRFTIVNGLTGNHETKTQTIRRLTENELIVEEGGATSKLVRVK